MSKHNSPGTSKLMLLAGICLLYCHVAMGQLTPSQAVFTSLSGTCGVVDAGTMSVVTTFGCDSGAEAVDVTSNGARSVIGSCFTSTIALVDLTLLPAPPAVLFTIPSGTSCVQELDIAPNDSFGIADGSGDGLVSKFTLAPFAVTGTLPGYAAGTGGRSGSPQDVHIDMTSTTAVHPFFDTALLQTGDVTGLAPVDGPTIATTNSHHGISLNEADNDTILATIVGGAPGVTVASLSGLSQTTILATTGATESVDIKCDGSRAVVETGTGLDWIDMTTPLPTVISPSFGPARCDGFSTSTVAFSQDGSLLFVGGGSAIDVYDATTDPPTIMAGSPIGAVNVNVATVPCLAVIEVDIDIKFCSNPNGFNCKSKGKTPVTIFGTSSFDVNDIDISLLQLCEDGNLANCTGAPINSSVFDRGDPTTDIGAAMCAIDPVTGEELHELNQDGFDDLDVRFDTQEVVGVIGCGGLSKGDASPTLVLIGATIGGTPITSVPIGDVGIDQLLIQKN